MMERGLLLFFVVAGGVVVVLLHIKVLFMMISSFPTFLSPWERKPGFCFTMETTYPLPLPLLPPLPPFSLPSTPPPVNRLSDEENQ